MVVAGGQASFPIITSQWYPTLCSLNVEIEVESTADTDTCRHRLALSRPCLDKKKGVISKNGQSAQSCISLWLIRAGGEGAGK